MEGTILVGTAGQGILRSIDDGATWHRLGLKEAIEFDGTVRCLLVDPRDPKRVFAGAAQSAYARLMATAPKDDAKSSTAPMLTVASCSRSPVLPAAPRAFSLMKAPRPCTAWGGAGAGPWSGR